MLATPNADYEGPRRRRETCEAARRWQDNPWVIDGLFVTVDDVDAHHARAVAAGATVIRVAEGRAAPPVDGRSDHDDAHGRANALPRERVRRDYAAGRCRLRTSSSFRA